MSMQPTSPSRKRRAGGVVLHMILLVPASYALGLVGYGLANYQSVLTTGWRVGLYLGVPAVFALGWMAFLIRGGRELKAKLATATVSMLISLILADWLLFGYGPVSDAQYHQLRARVARAEGKPYDLRTMREVVLDLRSQQIPAVPSFGVATFYAPNAPHVMVNGTQVLPLSGISQTPTVLGNESGTYIVYNSDEYGFNNPAGTHAESPPDVAALGDSFAQGFAVPAEETIPGWLRRHYPKTVNLGLAGAGPLAMLAQLTEYASPLKPKVVLWFYFEGNDLLDLESEKETLLARYLESGYSQQLRSLQGEIDPVLWAEVERRLIEPPTSAESPWWVNRLMLRNLRGALTTAFRLRDPEPDYNLPLFRQVLEQARDRTRAWGGQLYFIYLPQYERFSKRSFTSRYPSEVKQIVEDLGLTVIDMTTVFEGSGDPLRFFPYRIRGHYTAEGYKLVADTVRAHLELRAQESGIRAQGTGQRAKGTWIRDQEFEPPIPPMPRFCALIPEP